MTLPMPDHDRSIRDHPRSRIATLIARIVVVYVAGSAAAFLFGNRLIDAFLDAFSPVSDLFFTVLFCVLGPFSTLSHALMGRGYGLISELSVSWPAILVYAVTTALLAPCLVLTLHRKRMVRLLGYCSGAIVWTTSGYVTLLGLMGA